MILTVTLNASVDKRYQLSDAIADYQVQRARTVTNTAGGKGLNCTRAIAALGEEVLPTGFVGGFNGDYLCSLLEKDGLPNDFLHTTAETRSCINVLDETGASTEFLEPSEPIAPQELDGFLEKYEQLLMRPLDPQHKIEAVTLNGSLPTGAPNTFYQKLIHIAHEMSVPVLLDTSGDALLQGLVGAPTFIKPNLDEIEVLLQNASSSGGNSQSVTSAGAQDDESYISQATSQVKATGILQKTPDSALLQRIKGAKNMQDVLDDICSLAASVAHTYHIPYVAISLGKDGALLFHEGTCYYARPPKIDVVNPVGSGDTMVGAFAVGFVRSLSPDAMLVSAIAAASANCLTDKTGSFDYSDYERIKEQISVVTL